MSVSGSYDNTSTMSEIIYDAFSFIGVIDDRETLPAEEWVYGKRILNEAMSHLSIHKGLWLIDNVDITLTPGTTSYSIGVGETVDAVKPMRVIHARRTGSVDIPISIVSRDQYLDLPNKQLQSPANLVYYDPRRDNGTLYVWPTGTSGENTITITTQRPVQDFDIESNNPDLPKEWVLLIKYYLATLIAPKYLGDVPTSVQNKADTLLAACLRFDEEEVSLFVQP